MIGLNYTANQHATRKLFKEKIKFQNQKTKMVFVCVCVCKLCERASKFFVR